MQSRRAHRLRWVWFAQRCQAQVRLDEYITACARLPVQNARLQIPLEHLLVPPARGGANRCMRRNYCLKKVERTCMTEQSRSYEARQAQTSTGVNHTSQKRTRALRTASVTARAQKEAMTEEGQRRQDSTKTRAREGLVA
eukprot:2762776-Pleurochrysis_carterae.AAC.2